MGTILHFNKAADRIWCGGSISAYQQVNRPYGPVKRIIEDLLQQTFDA
jgi:hypothetical protein